MSNILKNIFLDKQIDVNRHPIFTLSFGGTKWGILLPEMTTWNQLLLLLLIQTLFSILVASLVYKLFIPYRKFISVRIVGYTFIGYICVNNPFWIIRYLELENKMLRWLLCMVGPTGTLFRFIEAMHGYSPPAVEASLSNYVLYYSSGLEVQFDKSTHRVIRATTDKAFAVLRSFLRAFLMASAFISLFRQYRYPFYEPYASSADANTCTWTGLLTEMLDWNLLRNNIITAILFQFHLTSFTESLAVLMTAVFRIEVKNAFYNPLFESLSPSEFWGRRWNTMIHSFLKRGVFKPVYHISSSKIMALIVSFIASGLFHEWILIHIYINDSDYKPRLGINTLFFLWNAMIIAFEYSYGSADIFQWIKLNVPPQIITLLVLCTAIPIAHWFLHPYIKSDFLVHGERVYPMIVRLP